METTMPSPKKKEPRRDPASVIYKYELSVEDAVEIQMPAGADVLCVQVQQSKPYLWAKVHTSATETTRKFYVVGTGHPMPVDAKEYVGTFQLQGGSLVFHVFEG